MYENIFNVANFYNSNVSFLIMIGFALTVFVVCSVVELFRLEGNKIIENFLSYMKMQKIAKRSIPFVFEIYLAN